MTRGWRPIPSPCIKVCAIDPVSSTCFGCQRTMAEIAAWGSMADAVRDRIMAELPARRAAMGARAVSEPRR